MTRFTAVGVTHYPRSPLSRSLDEKMKTPDSKNAAGSHDFVNRSSFYQEYLAEREEILRHKWIESEKAGHDIGFEHALIDWVRNHRDKWRQNRRGTNPGLSHSN